MKLKILKFEYRKNESGFLSKTKKLSHNSIRAEYMVQVIQESTK